MVSETSARLVSKSTKMEKAKRGDTDVQMIASYPGEE
jgi:hypothetical protein